MATGELVREMVDAVTVRPEGDHWVGVGPAWFGDHLFGGFVLGQAVHAATRAAPDGFRIHSLHAYFLRPVKADEPVAYRVSSLRDGRTFAGRTVEGMQQGKPVVTMLCSFTADADGPEYQLADIADVPGPEEVGVEPAEAGWLWAKLGPTPAAADGRRQSTHRAWIKVPEALPADPHLHAALLAYATDWTDTGGRPLRLDGDVEGMISLDHAAWFHRPPSVDEWLYYDVHSLVNTGSRGLLRGHVHDRSGRLVASVAQEMLLR